MNKSRFLLPKVVSIALTSVSHPIKTIRTIQTSLNVPSLILDVLRLRASLPLAPNFPEHFKADRSFIFAILSDNKILFLGRGVDLKQT
jgi:hypothetical protein